MEKGHRNDFHPVVVHLERCQGRGQETVVDVYDEVVGDVEMGQVHARKVLCHV